MPSTHSASPCGFVRPGRRRTATSRAFTNGKRGTTKRSRPIAAQWHWRRTMRDFTATIFTLLFHPDCGEDALRREHAEWNRRHAARFTASSAPHDNDPAPARRLRIGYAVGSFGITSSPGIWCR